MKTKHLGKATLFILLNLISLSPWAQTKSLISPAIRPNMLELYTSQGCSSCPPAERWLNTFTAKYKAKPELWQHTIPINFHVDYWDYLGWPDPYANKAFSQRQRLYKHFGHSRNVATPGFVVDGKAWNGWFYRRPIPVTSTVAPGIIKADINGEHYNVRYQSQEPGSRLQLHIAILGFKQSSFIKTGENHGKRLNHDFVVLAYDTYPLQANRLLKNQRLPGTETFKSKDKAVVIWVSQGRDPKPLQAVADWL